MKNRKKIMAVLLAAALATTSMTAFASNPTTASTQSLTVSGKSIVEYDNSEEPEVYNVILPTVTDETYKLTIDREKLLNEYNKQSSYAADDAYFKTVGTKASIEFVSSGTFAFAKEAKATLTFDQYKNRANLGATITQGALKAALTKQKLYIWEPKATSGSNIEGKFTRVTDSNYKKVFDIKYEADNPTDVTTISAIKVTDDYKDVNSSNLIFDGKLYYNKHTYINTANDDGKYEAAAFITSDSALDVISENYKGEKLVYSASQSSMVTDADNADIKYEVVSRGSLAANTAETGKVIYTPEEIQYKKTSEDAKIINKSTMPIAVTVDVAVTSEDGLEFVTSGALNTVTSAAVSLGIKVGSDVKAWVKDGSAKVYYVLGKGYSDPMNKFMGTVNSTGAHDYYQYLPSTVTDSSVSFNLEADVRDKKTTGLTDADKEADKSWDAYNKAEPVVRPIVTVVYKFEAVEQDKTIPKLYTSKVNDGVGFEVSGSSTTGVAVATGAAATASGSTNNNSVACTMVNITSGNRVNITASMSLNSGVYIVANGNLLTTSSDKLTSVKLNGTVISVTTKGNSSGNGNAVYFKFPSDTTLHRGDVVTVVLDGTTYTYTIAS